MLGNDAVAECFQCFVAGDAGGVGDPPVRQTHHPFDRESREARLASGAYLNRRRGYATERELVAVDGWGVRPPILAATAQGFDASRLSRSSRQCGFRWHDAQSGRRPQFQPVYGILDTDRVPACAALVWILRASVVA